MKNDFMCSVTELIDAPIEKVWDSLTQPDQIRKYFFGTEAVSDWKKGSPIYFRGEWDGKKYEDKGTILETNKPILFKYTYWSSMSGIEDKPENYVVVTYSLEKSGDKTRLTIMQENIPDEKTKKHSQDNWQKVITDLKNFVEKGVGVY